jgi:hypothetical protein
VNGINEKSKETVGLQIQMQEDEQRPLSSIDNEWREETRDVLCEEELGGGGRRYVWEREERKTER